MTKIYCDSSSCSWSVNGVCQKEIIEIIKGVDEANFDIRYCRDRNIKKRG